MTKETDITERTDGHGPLRQAVMDATASAAAEKAAYTQGEDRPLEALAGLMATYGATVASVGLLIRRSQKRLPERLDVGDLALMAVATHKLSRLIAKETITSPIRAPFTRLTDHSDEEGPHEEVRGTGARKAVGQLLSCPFCISQWIATSFSFGLVLAPRTTRWAMSVLTAVTGADFLQYAHAFAQQRASS